MSHHIRLREVKQQGRQVLYRFDTSLPLFQKKEFYVRYEREFPEASRSILNIPFVSVMASLSWMTGADLEVDVLDETYVASLQKAKEYFQRWFSGKWSFQGTFRTQTEVNHGSASRDGMLYSGGLDAMATYINHRDSKPLLFSFFGADVPLSQTKLVEICQESFRDFATTEGVELCCMESDLNTIFHERRLQRLTDNWWGEASHAMVLSGLTAPYSYRELRHLWIASSHVAGTVDYGWGSDYDLDSHLRWGNTVLVHDLERAARIEKMRMFVAHPEYYRFLRVCYTWWNWTGQTINCSRCEKCYRSICELMLNGVDPALCGFQMTDQTFPDMRRALEKPHAYYSFFGGGPASKDFWNGIQKVATVGKWLDRYGSGKFFEWLAGFDRLRRIRDTRWGRMDYELRKIRWNLMKKVSR